ncbi:hypothetical protein JOC75_000473 [Metabacillus crassostreae]|uniref:hypothetical protein n=1 Tax=Metabacillus crassostreae TaxID=929098 RepID=UPI001957C3FE|nr:hypothetical protein [Metabacillus crassostreae]MBM7602503.1 hypothetical protein [Metabacillus crassostreae]
MKRLPFEPPTKHYDERIEDVDEKICELIRQRKDLSSNNPGFPTKKLISSWSKKYGFYEDFLNGVFAELLSEEMYKPIVVPKGFVRNIPILRFFEKDELFYSVTFIRQYKNASIVHFSIDREDTDEINWDFREREHTWFGLVVDDGKGTEYDCQNEGGGGSGGHTSYTFIVTPSVPDDSSEIKFIFKEYKAPFKEATGFEFII